jgi:hypothetical protein
VSQTLHWIGPNFTTSASAFQSLHTDGQTLPCFLQSVLGGATIERNKIFAGLSGKKEREFYVICEKSAQILSGGKEQI